jgi:hypothetical protein
VEQTEDLNGQARRERESRDGAVVRSVTRAAIQEQQQLTEAELHAHKIERAKSLRLLQSGRSDCAKDHASLGLGQGMQTQSFSISELMQGEEKTISKLCSIMVEIVSLKRLKHERLMNISLTSLV